MNKCSHCYYKEKNWDDRMICQHKPSMEGTEAISEYVECETVVSCDFFCEAED